MNHQNIQQITPLSPRSIKQSNHTLDISDILLNQSNDKQMNMNDREKNDNMFIIFIDTSSEIQKQIMKNDTEIECYNKEIREIQKQIDGTQRTEQIEHPSSSISIQQNSFKSLEEQIKKIELQTNNNKNECIQIQNYIEKVDESITEL